MLAATSQAGRTICVEYTHVTLELLTWVDHVGDFTYIYIIYTCTLH